MSFYVLSISFLTNVSERKFFSLSSTTCMNIYENIQHSMDIYNEISTLRHSIFLNLSIYWHLKLRYSTWIVGNVSSL